MHSLPAGPFIYWLKTAKYNQFQFYEFSVCVLYE